MKPQRHRLVTSEPGCVNPVDARCHRVIEREVYTTPTGPARPGAQGNTSLRTVLQLGFARRMEQA